MDEKEKLLRKIQIKDSNGLDTSGEVARAAGDAALLPDENLLEHKRLQKRLLRDVEALPVSSSYEELIYHKMKNIEKVFREFEASAKFFRREQLKEEVDYLNVLALNVMWDTENICDTANPSFDIKDLKSSSLSCLSSLDEYLRLFPGYLKAVFEAFKKGPTEIYKQITDIVYLTEYGTDIFA